jgi:uncharacterized membrane protein YoaT (DUF817 family)
MSEGIGQREWYSNWYSNRDYSFEGYSSVPNVHLWSGLLLLAVGSLVVYVLREFILKVRILISFEHKLCQI